ncbi:amino acid permease/ SLC12A domain-containing protein [Zychaea mexicana]|uniref:amino acid permease/ SLC12A domain-containing protein n=1 Tax=Zychaea mexicana TaxID=64656 RepID=UPI0022FE2C63|nr:amino acid permease/ SLC12A domain-containing protein [Zychaea mexicana]KAI9498160.1 amino acid permease/ SLC12A domain-containing protein [Zychaea mexicana]
MFRGKKDAEEHSTPPPAFGSEKVEEEYMYPTEAAESFTSKENTDLQEGTKRGLDARHVQMIALGGTIGTGLFLNSGGNIATAGPAGAFIAYCVVGFMVYCIMTCLGEMATFMPVSGSFNHYATRFIDPALGFALGWNYWFSSVTIATELAAAATIIRWWSPVMPDPAWSTIFMVLILSVNLVGVRLYGEMEYWFALIKILVVIMFIIVGILVTTGAVGAGTIGFDYWNVPGAFVDGAEGTVSVLLSAGFSFQGTEVVGVTAGEAKNPTKTLPRAIRNTFYRIVFFYIVTIFLIGLCVPADNPNLSAGDESATTASFTLIFELAGINGGAHFVNAVILLSVLSAANSSLYTTSRTLLGLARDGNAPAFLGRVNRFGSPYLAVVTSSLIGFACVFVSIYSASAAFVWFLSITAVSGFISWWGIAFVHLRFRRAYLRQGRSLDDLPYRAFAYPYSGIFASTLCILIILGQGYGAFAPEFDRIKFVTNYIGVVPAIVCYVVYKLVRRTKIVPLLEVDFETGRVTAEDREQDEAEIGKMPWYKQILAWIF